MKCQVLFPLKNNEKQNRMSASSLLGALQVRTKIEEEMGHAMPKQSCLPAYVDSDGPDQPAHPCSLIRVFPGH